MLHKEFAYNKFAQLSKAHTKPKELLHSEEDLLITAKLKDISWLLGRSLTRIPLEKERETESIEASGTESSPLHSTPVPVWSGYNSLVHETLPATRIGTPRLIAAPVHEWNTMLTVLKQAQQATTSLLINSKWCAMTLIILFYVLKSCMC